jgi:integrase
VRIHDLRHTFASFAAASGMSLHMIGKLLGHSSAQTTRRYAHLAEGTVKVAANDVSSIIAGHMPHASAGLR